MRRILPWLLVLSLCTGCFVFDELDKGQKIMDQYSHASTAHHEERSAPPVTPKKKEEPGLLAGLTQQARDWWTHRNDPKPVEPDPDDIVVHCSFGGHTQFMRRSDCELRGGRPV